jgi:hypothetical protein
VTRRAVVIQRSAAPARCLEHLSIHVGPYGEFVPPVDPLGGADVN